MQSQHRIDIRTLAIAAVASAAAAAVTSQIWFRGTPFAAALTPVIITLVSQMLHRPADRIAQRLTTETDALPEAAGAGGPPRSQEVAPEPAPDPDAEPARNPDTDRAPNPKIHLYRRRRKIAWGAALVTGLLAFAIAAVALSVPELITGNSLFDSSRRTTLGGAKVKPSDDSPPEEREPAAPEPERTETTREPDDGAPERRPRQRETTPDETTEEEPPPTTTEPTDTTESPSSGTRESPTGGALAPTAE